MTQNETEKNTLEKLRSELKRLDCSQTEAARQIGISPSTLTQLLNGSYGADAKHNHEKIEKWLKLVALDFQIRPKRPEWVQTQNGEKVMATLNYGQMSGGIVLIYGESGVGKTTASKAYQRQYPNVWIATASPAKNSVSAALEALALAIGIKELSGRAARIERETVDMLQGTQGLVVIDEAQNLDPQALEALRIVHDLSGVGFAFIGNERAFTRMHSGKQAPYLKQLNGRIAKKLSLFKVPKEDVEAVSKGFEVQDKASLKRLCEIGQRPGGLRMVEKVLSLASLGAGSGIPELSHIEAAAKNLGL